MKTYKKIAFWALTSILLSSCGEEQITKENETKEIQTKENQEDFNSDINTYIGGLASVKQQNPFEERAIDINQGRSKSPIFELKDYEQAVEVDEQMLFSENQEIFYPGSLVNAESVVRGAYTPIVVPRKPIKISVSLIGENPSVTINEPKLSTVREKVSTLLKKDFDVPPANISYSSYEIHDKKHLKLALGAGYKGTAASVEASAGFTYDNDKTRFIVKIQQVFYTMDLDLPQYPSDFFIESQLSKRATFGNAKPLYISSVKMGRILILAIETSLTKAEATAKIQASISGVPLSLNAETAFEYLAKNSTIRGRVLGGNSTLAGGAISDLSAVKNFLKQGASYSKDNPGIPISYNLRELGTNKSFKTVIYSKYKKKDFDSYKDKLKISFSLKTRLKELKTLLGKSTEISSRAKGVLRREKGLNDVSPVEDKSNFLPYIYYTSNIDAYEFDNKLSLSFYKEDNSKLDENIIFDLPSSKELIEKVNYSEETNLKNLNLKIKDRSNKYIMTFLLSDIKVK